MKHELYKRSFERYTSVKHKDTSPVGPNDYSDEYTNLYPKFVQTEVSNDEETFVREFGNPIYTVTKTYCMIVLEEKEEKISLKLFFGNKIRKVGRPFFKVSKNVEFLTVNKNTGDIYQGFLHNYQKKRKFTRSIRKNYFSNSPLLSITSKIKNSVNNYFSRFENQGGEIVQEVLNIFISKLFESDHHNLGKEQLLMKFYLDKKGIKYPNNFWVYVPYFFGKEFRKIMKKNELRLIDSFMQVNKISGKKLKKVLHEVENINLHVYLLAKKLFGEDWLNQDYETLRKLINSKSSNSHDIISDDVKSFFSHEELKRVYGVFKKTFIEDEINSYTFLDHLRTYVKLKEYGERSLRWMSDGRDYNFFQKEHLDWTDKLQFYKNGVYERTYPDYFQSIESEIEGYFPVILHDSKSYNEESHTQSNCVKGYIGRVSSFIVSLRKGGRNSNERATIEYRISKNEDEVLVQRVQTLGRYNSILDEIWVTALLKLDEKVISCHKAKYFEPVKIKKTCMNGLELFSDSHFDEKGNLTWSNKKNNYSYYDEW